MLNYKNMNQPIAETNPLTKKTGETFDVERKITPSLKKGGGEKGRKEKKKKKKKKK